MKTIYLIRHAAPFVEIDNFKNNTDITWLEFNQNMIYLQKGKKEQSNFAGLRN